MPCLPRPVRIATRAAVATSAGALAWGTLIERNWYALRRFTLPVLAPGTRPITVLQLTDLHLVPRQRKRIAWVQGLAALRPDFVLNTGDNCSDLLAVPAVLDACAPLLEFPGAYVLGSNDFYAPAPKNPLRYFDMSHKKGAEMGQPELPVEELRAGFDQSWLDLNNARTRVDIAGVPVELVGVCDPHIDLDEYDMVSGPAASDVAVTIGVLHAPYTRVLDPMVRDGARLVIAGHTHGGQVALPGYGALTTNCDLDNRRGKGVSRWWPGANGHRDDEAPQDAAYLHVSAGVGHNKYNPIRFSCRPEASLLTLVPRTDSHRPA